MNIFQHLAWRVNGFIGTLSWTPTANTTITLPPRSGTVALSGDTTNSDVTRSYAQLITVSAGKTFGLTDGGTVQECRQTSALTLTIPLDSAVNFAIGSEIRIVRNNTGTVNLNVSAGVTLVNQVGSNTSPFVIASWCVIRKVAANRWVLEIPTTIPSDLGSATTATTQAAGTNNTTLATTAFVGTALTNSVRPAIEASGSNAVALNLYSMLVYSAVQLDTNSMLDAATGLITIPAGQGGMYEYSGYATPSVAGNNLQLRLFRNNALAATMGSHGVALPNDVFYWTSTTQKIRLAAGDVVSVRFYMTQIGNASTGIQCVHNVVFMRIY